MIDKLSHFLAQANISLSQAQKQQLIDYVALLHKWNRAYNLTSVRDPQQMLTRHILDSLVAEPWLEGDLFIDVGTGPGLPGVPLAIIRPDARFTLLDSLGKRIRFLRQVQYDIGLKNITPVQCRVEMFTGSTFDGVISRAFASLSDMLRLCHHLPSAQGAFYALKGQCSDEEMAMIPTGYHIESVKRLTVPGLEEERHLLIVRAQ